MEKFYVTWDEIEELVDLLAKQIIKSGHQIEYIFGLQRGGLIPAVMLSHKLSIPMTQELTRQNILVVDDICDSGKTFMDIIQKNPFNLFASLHYKPHTSKIIPDAYGNEFYSDAWLVYPWEQNDSDAIQDYLK